jgi:hypothetical protein
MSISGKGGSQRANADLIKTFIIGARKKRKILMDALLRCATDEDQIPAETLRSAIDAISNTIAAVRAGTKSLVELKRYHVNVFLPVNTEDKEMSLTLEITQRAKSHPLPPKHYIEVTVALTDPVVTPITKARGGADYSYLHTFNLGERTVRQVERLRSSDVEFRIFKRTTTFSGGANLCDTKIRPILVGLATAPLAPLSFALNTTAPLNFLGIDGRRTPFLFDVRFSVPSPLACKEDMVIDELIDVIRE